MVGIPWQVVSWAWRLAVMRTCVAQRGDVLLADLLEPCAQASPHWPTGTTPTRTTDPYRDQTRRSPPPRGRLTARRNMRQRSCAFCSAFCAGRLVAEPSRYPPATRSRRARGSGPDQSLSAAVGTFRTSERGAGVETLALAVRCGCLPPFIHHSDVQGH